MTIEQQQDKPAASTQGVVIIFVVILAALTAASIYNIVDGRTAIGIGGLAVAAAIVPVALRARAGTR